MNIKSRLEHIAHLLIKDRRIGQTTMIAKAAKETGGMVLTRTHQQAKQVEREHKVTARSMEVNLEGFAGPFYLDHYAASALLLKAAHKIEALEETIGMQKEIFKMYRDEVKALSNAIEKDIAKIEKDYT